VGEPTTLAHNDVMRKDERSVGATSVNSGISERAALFQSTYRMNEKDSDRQSKS
jgi:hypothetical protein